MRLDDFVQLLDKPRKSGRGFIARCPAHEDRSPSLSVRGDGERILVHCFAGCRVEDVLSVMGLELRALYENSSNGYVPAAAIGTPKMTAAYIEERLMFTETMPKALPKPLRPVPALVPELIPDALRPWLVDIAERMQCPLEFPAVAALVAAGAIIGNSVVVKPKGRDPWLVVPNIWGAVIGEPGVMKSPSVSEAMVFANEIERREGKAFDAMKAEIAADVQAREAEKKALRYQLEQSYRPKRRKSADQTETIVDRDALKQRLRELEEQVAPTPKRLITSDSTVEKLGELLNNNPRGLLNMRDELSGFIDTLDKPGREGDRAFYLEAWGGLGTHSVDRIGRGSFRIRNVTLSIFGTIQPSIIAPLFKADGSKSADDGFIQRFQAMVYPDIAPIYRYIDRDPVGRDEAREVFEGLFALDLNQFDQLTEESGGHRFVRFGRDAQQFFQAWLVELENTLRNGSIGSSPLQGHLGKYRSFMPALALIFHLIDHVADKDQPKEISLTNAERAAAWCGFFKSHAERLYDSAASTGLKAAHEILKKIQSGDLGDEFTAREIYRNKWRGLTEPNTVKEGLEVLVLHDYVQEVSIGTGGKPKIVFFVNPNARRQVK